MRIWSAGVCYVIVRSVCIYSFDLLVFGMWMFGVFALCMCMFDRLVFGMLVFDRLLFCMAVFCL